MKIAIDTSVVVAIFAAEGEADAFIAKMLACEAVIAAPTLVETYMVLAGRNIRNVHAELAEFVRQFRMERIAFDLHHAELAQAAFRKFGKGRHPARLNFGDCMSYALAKSLEIPLLYKGDDFVLTDIERGGLITPPQAAPRRRRGRPRRGG